MSAALQWTGRAIFIWPLKGLWRFVTFLEKVLGIVFCLLAGLVLCAVGVFLTMTYIGAVIGIPLALLGTLLLIRGIF
jgi:hypothetical protein